VGSTLASWEDGRVDSSLEIGLLVLSEEDQPSSRSSEGLVAEESKREESSRSDLVLRLKLELLGCRGG